MPKIELAKEPVTISSNDVLKLATKILKDCFNLLVNNGYKYTADTIFHLLIKGSVDRSTIEDVCNQLEKAPHSNA